MFWGVIRNSLTRQDYELVWLDAMDEFKKHDKPSAAKKEANLIGLKALKELGINWREVINGKSNKLETISKARAYSARREEETSKDKSKSMGKTASGTKASGKPSKILQMSKDKE